VWEATKKWVGGGHLSYGLDQVRPPLPQFLNARRSGTFWQDGRDGVTLYSVRARNPKPPKQVAGQCGLTKERLAAFYQTVISESWVTRNPKPETRTPKLET
jgi:hypothetical protein